MAQTAQTLWELPRPPAPAQPKTPAERIRYVREHVKKWNQGRLAQEVRSLGLERMSRSTLNNIEGGGRKASFAQASFIARALGVSLGQLGYTSADFPELLLVRDPDASTLFATPSKRSRQTRPHSGSTDLPIQHPLVVGVR